MTRAERSDPRGAGPGPAPRLPLLTGVLSAAALVLFWVPGAAEALAWDRHAIASGELWRLATGHLVHWSTGHLVWDVGAFALLGALCESRGRGRTALCLAGSALAISGLVWLLLPDMLRYGGLSGLDSALFAQLGVDLLREQRRQSGIAALGLGLALCLAFALKIGFEATHGGAVFVGDLPAGVGPVPGAHLAGALSGLLAATPEGAVR